MRLENLQRAATYAWRIHLIRCGLITLVPIVVSFALRRQLGFSYPTFGFDRLWLVISLMFAAYIAEWTRHEWRQFQGIKRLKSLPSLSELRAAKAKEKLHDAMLNAAFLCCVF